MKFLLVFLLFFTLACSRLEFKTGDKTATWGQKHNPSTSERFEIHGERKFYLWGHYPQSHEVFIDNEIINKGHTDVYELSIEEYQTWQNFFWMVATLGMFTPQNYVIQGKGVKGE